MSEYHPQIVIEDCAASASKRRRLNTPLAGDLATQSACHTLENELLPHKTPIPSVCATTEGISDNAIVCYGMVRHIRLILMANAYIAQVSDLAVNMPPNHVASSLSIQGPIRFESPRTIRYGVGDAPAGWLDDYGGKLLGTLVADSELILQLVTLSTPVAPTTGKKTFKNALSLGVIIYGPRYLFSHIGDFMTQAGCYLDDPVGCDRNVPYMNPQYLCSFHEEPSMTFELSQLQHSLVENSAQASRDILSGFETTEDLDLSDTPTALRTKLQMYVVCHERRNILTLAMKPSKTGTYFPSETRER
jgi:hypothetical protein